MKTCVVWVVAAVETAGQPGGILYTMEDTHLAPGFDREGLGPVPELAQDNWYSPRLLLPADSWGTMSRVAQPQGNWELMAMALAYSQWENRDYWHKMVAIQRSE